MHEHQLIQAAYSGAQLCFAALYVNCIATYRTSTCNCSMRTRCWSKTWPAVGYIVESVSGGGEVKCPSTVWMAFRCLCRCGIFHPAVYCWMCMIDKLGTSVGKGLTTSCCRQPQWTEVVTCSRYCQEQHCDAQTRSQLGETWYANLNNNSNDHNGTIRTRDALQNNWRVVVLSGTLCCIKGKKTEQQQWLDGGLHGSTTTSITITSITASDITRVVGCHSACHYYLGRGLLLVVSFVTDGWLLHLDFFLFPCLMLLFPLRRLVADTTNTPMLLPLPSPSPQHCRCIALCCVVLCGDVMPMRRLRSWFCCRC